MYNSVCERQWWLSDPEWYFLEAKNQWKGTDYEVNKVRLIKTSPWDLLKTGSDGTVKNRISNYENLYTGNR